MIISVLLQLFLLLDGGVLCILAHYLVDLLVQIIDLQGGACNLLHRRLRHGFRFLHLFHFLCVLLILCFPYSDVLLRRLHLLLLLELHGRVLHDRLGVQVVSVAVVLKVGVGVQSIAVALG